MDKTRRNLMIGWSVEYCLLHRIQCPRRDSFPQSIVVCTEDHSRMIRPVESLPGYSATCFCLVQSEGGGQARGRTAREEQQQEGGITHSQPGAPQPAPPPL